MARPELSKTEQRGKMRFIAGRGGHFGERIHFLPVAAAELRAFVVHYSAFLMTEFIGLGELSINGQVTNDHL